jgi:hypothetical protein
MVAALLLGFSCGTAGCSIGEGEGEVMSERLYIEDCWNGEFNLRPSFFAANPYRETMMIRIQRGEQLEEESDGVLLLVNDAPLIREELMGQEIPLGISPSITPPGQPIVVREEPLATLSLYLHDTCHVQNGVIYSVGGWIRFDSLFSGNVNEDSADRRLTEAEFEAIMADPRDGVLEEDADGKTIITYPEDVQSVVRGSFRFFFHRGSPAQPFP